MARVKCGETERAQDVVNGMWKVKGKVGSEYILRWHFKANAKHRNLSKLRPKAALHTHKKKTKKRETRRKTTANKAEKQACESELYV